MTVLSPYSCEIRQKFCLQCIDLLFKIHLYHGKFELFQLVNARIDINSKPTFETRGKNFNARIIEEELKESETSIYCMHTTT